MATTDVRKGQTIGAKPGSNTGSRIGTGTIKSAATGTQSGAAARTARVTAGTNKANANAAFTGKSAAASSDARNINNTSGENTSNGAGGKKPRRKMKKQVRRTLGGVLLASAVAVAAIPTPDAQATPKTTAVLAEGDAEKIKISVSNNHSTQYTADTSDAAKQYYANYLDGAGEYTSSVPFATDSTDSKEKIVYISETGLFQFVYMEPAPNQNKVAVILGYTGNEDTLTIPDKFQAYRKYTDTVTMQTGVNCLMSANDEFLFYVDIRDKVIDGYTYYTVTVDEDSTFPQKNSDGTYTDVALLAGQTIEVNNSDAYIGNFRDDDGDGVYDHFRTFKEVTEEVIVEPTPTPDPETGIAPDPETRTETNKVEILNTMQVSHVTDYSPCTYNTRDKWDPEVYNPSGTTATNRDYNLYYFVNNERYQTESDGTVKRDSETNMPVAGQAMQVYNDTAHYRVEADVAYIGQEYLGTNDGESVVSGAVTSPNQGVFYDKSNLVTLSMGENIRGIGDFAFYQCSSLKEVNFTSQLDTIGNGAFAECTGLESVNIASNARLRAIGKDAFFHCKSLKSFTTNTNLYAIGDCAFENCEQLTDFNFVDNGNLKQIGYHAFRGCSSLGKFEFPSYYVDTTEPDGIEVDTFEGCSSLQYMVFNNDSLNLKVTHKDDSSSFPRCTDNTWDKFKNTVPDSFYIEANDGAVIHETCSENEIAFKYMGQDIYEKLEHERDAIKDKDSPTDKSATVLYQVNSSNEVIKAQIQNGDHPLNLTIPDRIGPYNIDTIGDSAFEDNCDLTKVTIPASVKKIGNRAFAGCHNLEIVYFKDAVQIQEIGTDAFKTQDCTSSSTSLICSKGGEKLSTEPSLIFCGDMQSGTADTKPFEYAMNGSNNINTPAQQDAYIEYHSLYPESLVTQYQSVYNDDGTKSGKAVLIDYPRYSDYGSTNGDTDDKALEYVKSLPDVSYVEVEGTVPVTKTETTTVGTGDDAKTIIVTTTINEEIPQYMYVQTVVKDNNGNIISDDTAQTVYADNVDFYEKYNTVKNAVYNWNNRNRTDDGKTNPTPSQIALINAAINITVPSNVDVIDCDPNGKNGVGIFSGVKYDNQGFPIYFSKEAVSGASTATDGDGNTGYLIYTDADGNLYTDSDKTSKVSSSELYKITKQPYVPDSSKTNTDLQTIYLNGVDELDPFTFYGCTGLRSVNIQGPTEIGDYAFDDCTSLNSVTIGANVSDTGLRPFRGCTSLYDIDTSSNSYYDYSKGLLLRTDGNGTELVECLETRGTGSLGGYTSVSASELAGVTSIKDEAFMDCDELGKIDLSGASITEIPYRCFRDASGLNSVIVGNGTKQIDSEAFLDTKNLSNVTLPYSINTARNIAQDAFADTTTKAVSSFDDTEHTQKKVYVSCVEDSGADDYANLYVYLTPTYGEVFITHDVYFYDDSDFGGALLYHQLVNDGEDATPPTVPTHDGYKFNGWDRDYTNVTMDMYIHADFSPEDDPIYTVDFLDYNGTKLADTQYVSEGKSATPPTSPTREGYTFTGWKCTDDDGITYTDSDTYHAVTSNRVIVAQYSDNSGDAERHTVTFYSGYDGSTISTQKVDHEGAAVEPARPTYSGYTFKRWIPADFSNVTEDMQIVAYYEKNSSSGGNSGGSSSTATPTPTGTSSSSGSSSSGDVKTYTVTVSGGSGSGQYPAGAIVAINAYDMGTGQVFDKWTTSTAGVGFANASAPSTYFVMPAANVAVTATYRTGGSGSTTSTGSGGSGSGGTSTRSNNGSTTVDITKGGIPNTNVAGATVSGSTDNFVVKITDDQTASDLALRALQNSYGDITRIKYLPMDISLYDSTGRTKIADTSGLSVSITMPLPTELAQYAGNNKIASVAGGVLEPLNSRFTTVDGVPCISFTATHFSPYVVWVDTGDLREATIDYTPKTGDPIHPKWFLAIGLAAISFILFFKKDKKVAVKAS